MEFDTGLFKPLLPAFRVPCGETLQRDVVWKMGCGCIDLQPAWLGGRLAASDFGSPAPNSRWW